MKGLQGKYALVTGASSGIGAAVARRLAAEGCSVAVNYRSDAEQADASAVLAAIGGAGIIVQADVSVESEVVAMFETAIGRFGRLDILINNAGIQLPSPSDDVDMKDFDRVLGVDLRGAYVCCREAIRHFRSRRSGGAIVNNTSVHEFIPKPRFVSYAIAKSGMEGLTRTLALEYAAEGIRVNSVGPGATITPINAVWIDDEKARRVVESHIPMGRAASADEMAAVFAFLASDEASYVTGQTLFACGGLTLYPEFRTNWSS
ncbi:MAG: SDR family oxidoreductase [Acidobacteriota bacterium]|nr:SDR family oxidoreductase [Acidobacteriota bacterium]